MSGPAQFGQSEGRMQAAEQPGNVSWPVIGRCLHDDDTSPVCSASIHEHTAGFNSAVITSYSSCLCESSLAADAEYQHHLYWMMVCISHIVCLFYFI